MAIRNICIFGVGGVGGVMAGRIGRYMDGDENARPALSCIARGGHLGEIQRNGLIVKTEGRELVVRPSLATDRVEEIPAPDLVFVCVKSYDLDGVAQALLPVVKPETILIPLLNGVDIVERLRKRLSRGIILPACTYIGTHIERPGVVAHAGGEGRILMGRDPLNPSFYPSGLMQFFDAAAIPYRWFDDVWPAIWEKYIFIAAFGLVSAAFGATLGAITAPGELRNLAAAIMREIEAIARAKGIALPAGIVEISLEKVKNFPFETKTSYQRDVEQRGKPNEGDLFGGTIAGMGRQTGIRTPVAEEVYARIPSTLIL
jgi:2-dehydropantoate 2-reductase